MEIEKINYDYIRLKLTDNQKSRFVEDLAKIVDKNKIANDKDLLDSMLMIMRVYGILEYK